jgi:hypothetical protein
MKAIGTIRLAPGNVGYFDPITRIHLTISNPEKPVLDTMNTEGLKQAVRSGSIKLISGTLSPEVNSPVIEKVTVEEPQIEKTIVEEIPVIEVVVEETPVEKIEEIPQDVIEYKKADEVIEVAEEVVAIEEKVITIEEPVKTPAKKRKK